MKFAKLFTVTACIVLSSYASAERELPNFELSLGGGTAIGAELFNIDFTVNIPVLEYFSAQINLDSNYIFGDNVYGDFALSEFNGLGFVRVSEGRVGLGFGTLQKKSRSGAFETQQKPVTHLLASYYAEDVTIDWRYSSYSDTFEKFTSVKAGVIWYPDSNRRIGLYRERFDNREGWRLETFIQPEKYRQHLAVGALIRDGGSDILPYMGLELRYYFDRGLGTKARDRGYH
ncbi:hypothetical protein DN730_12035 [Marinomonas piezotolerans]|uniref:Outer membrane protein beta-barrel domain-containing protein n=1 Tax=Marinomonas piezotolerans TaxID=2213058 RepID=A0A370U817_9GAMM|nr:hypothetical protein [Marinomonas piezotolerans]RDL43905.1 hypothetical protein DN730_12035 [Marinomonas piezotolerans]